MKRRSFLVGASTLALTPQISCAGPGLRLIVGDSNSTPNGVVPVWWEWLARLPGEPAHVAAAMGGAEATVDGATFVASGISYYKPTEVYVALGLNDVLRGKSSGQVLAAWADMRRIAAPCPSRSSA